MPSFTKKQSKVIDTPIKNLLVSAAAGSGKTTVLVERIIKQVTDPVNPIDIDRILIITFTVNAAQQMKDKIVKKINERIEDPDTAEEVRERLRFQVEKVAYADICTTDSFCSKVLKNYFFKTDVDPNYRIADSNEVGLILSDIIKDTFEELYDNKDSDFLNLVKEYGDNRDDSTIIDVIKEIIEKSGSHPFPMEFFDALGKNYNYDSVEAYLEDSYFSVVIDSVKKDAADIISDCDDTIRLYFDNKKEGASGDALGYFLLNRIKKKCECLLEADDYLHMHNFIMSCRESESVLSKDETSITRSSFKVEHVKDKDVKKEISDKAKEIVADYDYVESLLNFDLYNIVEENRKLRPYVSLFIKYTKLIYSRLQEEKRRRNIMQFSDVAHEVINILYDENRKPTNCAKELQAKYDEIMIDEYQDSNNIQESIVEAIAGGKNNKSNVFMVGDVKQSIYRFRLAEPSLFSKKYHAYRGDNPDNEVIDLNMNFRSTMGVIGTVNSVFEKIMTEEFSGIAYDDNSRLNHSPIYDAFNGVDGTPDLDNEKSEYIVMIPPKNESKTTSTKKMLKVITDTIRDMVSKKVNVFEDGHLRPANFGDFCVLSRGIKSVSSIISDAFQDAGVPVKVQSGSGYFQTREVSQVVNYLRILDNPYQDIPLASVLRSFMGKLTDDELTMIRLYGNKLAKQNLNENKRFFYKDVRAYAEASNSDVNVITKGKLVKFFETYNGIRNIISFTSLRDIIFRIYVETGYYNYVSVLPAGNSRKANLDMLLIKAEDAEQTENRGISAFVRYVDELKDNELDEEEASTNKALDAVNVMTIHKSKGLEFPFVFLIGCDKLFKTDAGKFAVSINEGLGIRSMYPEIGVSKDTFQLIKMIANDKFENYAEEARILYVAMTRARQKLFMYSITGTNYHGGTGKLTYDNMMALKKLTRPLKEKELKEASSYAYMLGVALTEGTDYTTYREIDLSDIELNKEDDELKQHLDNADLDLVTEIKDYFAYIYPHEESHLPMKYSVSELKHAAMEAYEAEAEQSRPNWYSNDTDCGEDRPASGTKEKEPGFVNPGAVRGTLYHELMRFIIKTDIIEIDEIKTYMEKLVKEGKLAKEALALVKAADVKTFLETDLARRMRAADKKGNLFIEQPFVYGIKARDVNPLENSDERVLLQGVIDGFFIENDEVVIMDYKTDRVSSGEEGERQLIGRYSEQLKCYSLALNEILEKNVKEKIIYSFSLKKVIYL